MSQRGLSPLNGGSMLVYYTATKKPSVTPCGTMYLYLPKEWGFTAGELVNVNMTQDEEKMHLGKDCLLKGVGNKTKVLIDRSWNFDPDRLVRFTVYRRDQVMEDYP